MDNAGGGGGGNRLTLLLESLRVLPPALGLELPQLKANHQGSVWASEALILASGGHVTPMLGSQQACR